MLQAKIKPPSFIPNNMIDLIAMLKDYYVMGFEDGRRQEYITSATVKYKYAAVGADLTHALRMGQATGVFEGLPTHAIVEALGLRMDRAGDWDAKRVRAGLKALGYRQRSSRYKGHVVKGWFCSPPRIQRARQPADDDSWLRDLPEEDLPL